MRITVLSLFPEILRGFFETSIMKRAVEKGLVTYELVNIRDYATDKHHKCDDLTYGGGAGMLMLPGPLSGALEAAGVVTKSSGGARGARTVYLTPSGRLLNQAYSHDLALEGHLVLVCGRYEGIDQRIIDEYVDDELSIGDYVLSSGEIAALVLVDSVYRLIPGVISGESLAEESFSLIGTAESASFDALSARDASEVHRAALLEYPQFTRPAVFASMPVPDVLTSGHHAKIIRWRLKEQLRKTLAYRPELLASGELPKEALVLLKELMTEGGIDGPHPENPG
ncbi:MAG: tRNA (guanosine(37)-N1)-methyltransferase TrmD [Spirochaetota bacterium]